MDTDVCNTDKTKIIVIEIRSRMYFLGQDCYKITIIVDLSNELI